MGKPRARIADDGTPASTGSGLTDQIREIRVTVRGLLRWSRNGGGIASL